jgi:hypothetical protein
MYGAARAGGRAAPKKGRADAKEPCGNRRFRKIENSFQCHRFLLAFPFRIAHHIRLSDF